MAEATDEVKKRTLVLVVPTDVVFDSGAKLSDNFVTIKASIISYFADSADRCLLNLIEEQHLGDLNPSAAITPAAAPRSQQRQLGQTRLPGDFAATSAPTLISLDGVSMEKIAETADRMMEQMPKLNGYVILTMLLVTHSLIASNKSRIYQGQLSL